MNTPEGLNKVLEWKQSIEMLLDSIESLNILSQAELLLVMAGLCFLSSDAHVYAILSTPRIPSDPSLSRVLPISFFHSNVYLRSHFVCTASLSLSTFDVPVADIYLPV